MFDGCKQFVCTQFYDCIFAHHDVTQWFVKSWTAQLFLIVITTLLFWARRSHSEKLFGFENAFSSNLLHIPGSSARSNLDSNYKQITEEFFLEPNYHLLQRVKSPETINEYSRNLNYGLNIYGERTECNS